MVLTLDIHHNFQFGLFRLTNHHSNTNRLLQNSPFFIITLYKGAAKEVFSICLDLQALLTIFNNMDEEYEMIS